MPLTSVSAQGLQLEDCVASELSIRSGKDEASRNQLAGSRSRSLVPVVLSALLEGLGQAYNRQPVKAAGLAVAGLGLSTASGLNTWLIRKVPGVKHVTIGTEQIRPWLLAVWAATYALSLWDAWTGSSGPEAEGDGLQTPQGGGARNRSREV